VLAASGSWTGWPSWSICGLSGSGTSGPGPSDAARSGFPSSVPGAWALVRSSSSSISCCRRARSERRSAYSNGASTWAWVSARRLRVSVMFCGEIRGGLVEMLDGVFDRTDRAQGGVGDLGGVSGRAFEHDFGALHEIVGHEKLKSRRCCQPDAPTSRACVRRGGAAIHRRCPGRGFPGLQCGHEEFVSAGVLAGGDVAPHASSRCSNRNLVGQMADPAAELEHGFLCSQRRRLKAGDSASIRAFQSPSDCRRRWL
jgi:hypothetical protein